MKPARIAAPEVILARLSRPPRLEESQVRDANIFQAKGYRVHEMRCFECGGFIRYARLAGQPPDRRRRCCDCLSLWWSRRRAFGVA